jgi:hypothetical protein
MEQRKKMNKHIDDENYDYVNNNRTYRTNRAERSNHSSWAPNFIVGVADLAGKIPVVFIHLTKKKSGDTNSFFC